MLEGPHLVREILHGRISPIAIVVSETGLLQPAIAGLLNEITGELVVVADALFHMIADAQSPPGIAAEISIPQIAACPETAHSCLFLEGIQDAGNLGTILRSAAAFGVKDVLMNPGCTDPWAPKALRAGAGAQLVLGMSLGVDLIAELGHFSGTVAATVPSGGCTLHEVNLSGRVGWVFGAEGQGVSPALSACAHVHVSIPMAGGMESLNVAAAAAICFYEYQRQTGLAAPGSRRIKR